MKLAITVGLPHSGKTEFAQWLHKQHGYIIISLDTLRQTLSGDDTPEFPASNELVQLIAGFMARHFLKLGYSVIVDGEHITEEQRLPWIKVAEQFRIPLTMFWINTPFHLCKKRNEVNGGIYSNKRMDELANRFIYPHHWEAEHGRIEILIPDAQVTVQGVFISGKCKAKTKDTDRTDGRWRVRGGL
ncbi:MAG: ATP-binding protein [Candidatus Magnetobacterium sp. LHC-1]